MSAPAARYESSPSSVPSAAAAPATFAVEEMHDVILTAADCTPLQGGAIRYPPAQCSDSQHSTACPAPHLGSPSDGAESQRCEHDDERAAGTPLQPFSQDSTHLGKEACQLKQDMRQLQQRLDAEAGRCARLQKQLEDVEAREAKLKVGPPARRPPAVQAHWQQNVAAAPQSPGIACACVPLMQALVVLCPTQGGGGGQVAAQEMQVWLGQPGTGHSVCPPPPSATA
jgi:hypothetical protein